ncbi:MAG: MaoC family dehydratase [Aromatoleum sp.]|nr:MaoC family dehydratase [Aromatoleum sp.]
MVAIGERFAERVHFDAQGIRRFAELCGDWNPLHHDVEAAAMSPFGTLIASGPHLTSLMMGMNATYFSRRFDALGLEFAFRFVRAVPVEATLLLEWTVDGVVPKVSLAGHVVTLDGRAVDAAGGVYVTGRGTMLIRERQETS